MGEGSKAWGWVCVELWGLLDPRLNLPADVRAWEMSVSMLVKEELGWLTATTFSQN